MTTERMNRLNRSHAVLRRIVSLSAAGVVLLAGCTADDPAAPTSAADHEPVAPTNRVEIPATVRQNLGLSFANVERRAVASTLRIPGAFELQPRAVHEYRLPFPGRIELHVEQYDEVEAGDLLFRYETPQWPELQHEIIEGEQAIELAEAAIQVADARHREATAQLTITRDRLRSLADAELRNADLEARAAELEASLPTLDAERVLARTTLSNAHRSLEHAFHRASTASGLSEAELETLVEHDGAMVPAYRTVHWLDVRATSPGVVDKLPATDGAYADATALIVSTVELSRIRFRALALQSDLMRLTTSSAARIVAPAGIDLGPDAAVDAQLTLGLEAHPAERTLPVLAVPSVMRAWIRPGVSAFLEVEVASSGGPALAIPRRAVVRDGIVHVFFRRDPKNPNQAIRVEADLGADDGVWVVVNSGVMLGDEIVVDGAYELGLASSQSGTVSKGGHFHADGTFHAEDH